MHREGGVKTQQKTAIYRPGRGAWNRLPATALRRSQPCQNLGLRLLASRDNKSLLFKLPNWWHFVIAVLEN